MNSTNAPDALDLPAMRAFVLQAQIAYAKGKITLARAPDGRKSLTIENDTYLLTDEFDGGNPFCGIERLIRKSDNHVIWNGYYHGWLTQNAKDASYTVADVFNFLRRALQEFDEGTIFRGPASFKDGALTYTNTLEFGTFDCFYGHETIQDGKGRLLYYGRYGGGLVDLAEDAGEA